jgi:hypothetical protein
MARHYLPYAFLASLVLATLSRLAAPAARPSGHSSAMSSIGVKRRRLADHANPVKPISPIATGLLAIHPRPLDSPHANATGVSEATTPAVARATLQPTTSSTCCRRPASTMPVAADVVVSEAPSNTRRGHQHAERPTAGTRCSDGARTWWRMILNVCSESYVKWWSW